MKKKVLSIIVSACLIVGMPLTPALAEYESTVKSFTYEGLTIPSFDGDSFEEVNGNKPTFNSSEKSKGKSTFETYSQLDSLGRAGEAFASLNYSLMPTYDRGSISSVSPSGWIQAKYDIVSGGWLYNRCHIIGFQLTGIDGEHSKKKYLERDLITGTRFLNVGSGSDNGMLEYENLVAEYIRANKNKHVLYRVTPVYKDKNDLLASGVLMEGYSVEDSSIRFCVFCYNVQPGISIDYETGMSKISSSSDKNPDVPVKVGTPAIKGLTQTSVCYKTKTGSKYHMSKSCAGSSAIKTTISAAKGSDLTACKKCSQTRKFTVKYSSVKGATGYQVAYKKVGASGWKNAAVTSGTSKTVTGLACGTRYAVKVRAYTTTASGARSYGKYSKISYITTTRKQINMENSMSEIVRVVIKGESGYQQIEDAYRDKLTITSDSISYECKPKHELSKISECKWRYKTNNSEFTERFEYIAEKLLQAIQQDQVDCEDGNYIEIIITCSDKSKVKKASFGPDDSFKSVFNEIKKLVPGTEQVPGVLKTSEEDEQ